LYGFVKLVGKLFCSAIIDAPLNDSIPIWTALQSSNAIFSSHFEVHIREKMALVAVES
jgi:hypothetical protein